MAFIDLLGTTGMRAAVVCAAMVGLCASTSVLADNEVTTQATLLDRIQIEDLFRNYYLTMTTDGRKDLAANYAGDATLDLNGFAFEGHDAIKAVYNDDAAMGGPPGSRFNMLLNNVVIRVNGATATADMIFTGIISDTVYDTPRLFEQGREHSELVKQNGRWLIKKRVIASDGGLPKDFAKSLEKTQKRR